MQILGGKSGLELEFVAERQWAHGGSSQAVGDFCFVTAVNRAPMWLNRNLFKRHLRHINFNFAPF